MYIFISMQSFFIILKNVIERRDCDSYNLT